MSDEKPRRVLTQGEQLEAGREPAAVQKTWYPIPCAHSPMTLGMPARIIRATRYLNVGEKAVNLN
jgi:hypothetical protein